MPLTENMSFFEIARDRSVVTRAARIAIVVGTVLAIINQGDRIMAGHFDMAMLTKILLTYLVPYSVSTYSSCLAVRDRIQKVSQQDAS